MKRFSTFRISLAFLLLMALTVVPSSPVAADAQSQSSKLPLAVLNNDVWQNGNYIGNSYLSFWVGDKRSLVMDLHY
ncbi:MAG TPA: hypothetical protein PLH39_09615, partial [Promineifilum sp.]|nr:hypothetical protein [Promineifilum sp.]